MPVYVGIYDDHNAGLAAVSSDAITAYTEFERSTRIKNQAGWHPDLIGEALDGIGIDSIGAITAPDTGKLADLLRDRYDARPSESGRMTVGSHEIRLLPQPDLHPAFHVLACTTIPMAGPGVYVAVVFDAEQPRFSIVDLRTPLTAPPDLDFFKVSDQAWFNGAIFADFYGALFYGNGDLSNCGKLMGLSGWGRPRLRHTAFLEQSARRHFDAKVETWNGYRWVSPEAVHADAEAHLGTTPRDHRHPDVLDLAASAQELFTHLLVQQVRQAAPTIRQRIAAAGLPDPVGVLYGGGCALSVVSNREVAEAFELPVFIPPFAHDASQFVGGAIWAGLVDGTSWTPGTGWPGVPQHIGTVIGGSELARLGRLGAAATPAAIAQRLAEGRLVGLARAGAEAGPRALGLRSILACATVPGMRERINDGVKKREWYRPFAPAMPPAEFARYFGTEASPAAEFMLDAFRLRPQLRGLLAAVSGPDGMSRPQAVRTDDEFLTSVCTELGSATGHPVVLNTSLNAPGKTIAHDLQQVIADADALELDHLVLADTILDRAQIAALAAQEGR